MDLKTSVSDFLETSSIFSNVGRATAITLSLLLILIGTLGFIWDTEPGLFDNAAVTEEHTTPLGARVVIGSTTVATTIEMANTLLAKPGGYLENDLAPPGVWMDNIPNWEFGVLVQIRDMVRIMRKTLSRSQSQSQEDADLITAENQFYFDSNSWILPDTEGEYARGIIALTSYLERLGDDNLQDAQFYARADNLQAWLAEVETRLGSLSQRLSASVGKRQLDVSLAGDSAASQSTATNRDSEVKTPYFELDDTFYEARGTTWALIHLLRAIEVDFHDVLVKKNALVSLQQIIRELEPTQDTVWSPIVLNGSGLGVLANHSLVMGSHVSRANAAIIDLRTLLTEG